MTRYVNPQPRYVNKNGKALAGGKLNFYSAGTVTRRNTYSDSSFTIPNTNPVILDAEGRPEVNIFLDGVYKVVLTDSDDQVIWEKDPVGGVIGIQAFADWISDATYNVGDIVTGSDGYYYGSITNGNVGLDPTVESDDWERVQLLREWRTDLVYQTGDIVVGSDDIIYQSLTDENSANDPVSDKTNWSSVKDYWGAADGVATLDSSGLVPSSQIPPIAITDVYVVANQAARLALTAQVGDVAVQNDNNTAYILQQLPASTNANWIEFGIQNFGSAAFRDVGTSAGNVMEVGAGGLLTFNSGSITNPNDLGNIPNGQYSGFKSSISTTDGWPVSRGSTDYILIQNWNSAGGSPALAFSQTIYILQTGQEFFRSGRGDITGNYSWKENWNSDNQLALGASATSGRTALELGTAATKNISSTQISNWDTAYGWGDHSSAGYALAANLGSAATRNVGTDSGNVALYSDVQGNFVDKSTEQTITGGKTFEGVAGVKLKAETTNNVTYLEYLDSTGVRLGYVGYGSSSSDNLKIDSGNSDIEALSRTIFDKALGVGLIPTGSTADGVGCQMLPLGYVQSIRDGGQSLVCKNLQIGGIALFQSPTKDVVIIADTGMVVDGGLTATNIDATGYVRGSDPYLKTEKRVASITREQLDSIALYYFRWKELGEIHESIRGTEDIGVMANEVKAVFPECVRARENGTLTVDYAKFATCFVLADYQLRREGK